MSNSRSCKSAAQAVELAHTLRDRYFEGFPIEVTTNELVSLYEFKPQDSEYRKFSWPITAEPLALTGVYKARGLHYERFRFIKNGVKQPWQLEQTFLNLEVPELGKGKFRGIYLYEGQLTELGRMVMGESFGPISYQDSDGRSTNIVNAVLNDSPTAYTAPRAIPGVQSVGQELRSTVAGVLNDLRAVL